MARSKVTLNRAGIAQIMKSTEMHRLIQDVTEEIAENVREQGIKVGDFHGNAQIALPVEISMTTTDRAHGQVRIAHPAGLAVVAKYGALTKAASEAGLQVKAKN